MNDINYKKTKANLEERLKRLPKKDDISKDYNCPICRDTTYILNKEGVAYPCKCREKVLLKIKLKKSGLSDILAGKTFSNYIADSETLKKAKNNAINYCVKFIEDKEYNKSILLNGNSGSGKSHLGGAIMMNLIEKNIGCMYLDYIKFITEIRQSKYDSEKYNEIINKYQNSKILYIDDFLKGRIEANDINYVFELINYRYQKMKPMIITTEKTIEELFSYDEALASRIIEMCGGVDSDNIIIFKDEYSNYRLRR